MQWNIGRTVRSNEWSDIVLHTRLKMSTVKLIKFKCEWCSTDHCDIRRHCAMQLDYTITQHAVESVTSPTYGSERRSKYTDASANCNQHRVTRTPHSNWPKHPCIALLCLVTMIDSWERSNSSLNCPSKGWSFIEPVFSSFHTHLPVPYNLNYVRVRNCNAPKQQRDYSYPHSRFRDRSKLVLVLIHTARRKPQTKWEY